MVVDMVIAAAVLVGLGLVLFALSVARGSRPKDGCGPGCSCSKVLCPRAEDED